MHECPASAQHLPMIDGMNRCAELDGVEEEDQYLGNGAETGAEQVMLQCGHATDYMCKHTHTVLNTICCAPC